MKRYWSIEELESFWKLLPIDAFLNNYNNYIRYQKEIRKHYNVSLYNEIDQNFLKEQLYKIALEVVNQDNTIFHC